MESCEDVWFKQRAVIKLLNAEKIPPIDIHCHVQAGYGDNVMMSAKTLGTAV